MYLLKPCLLLLKPCFWLSYCPLVWYVSCSTSLWKIENLHKRALRFLPNNYVISYEQLLQKSSKASINLRNHRVLCMARLSEKKKLFYTENIFFDAASSCFCRHEILFCATSTLILLTWNTFSCNINMFFVETKLLFVQRQTFYFNTKLFFVQHQIFVLCIV